LTHQSQSDTVAYLIGEDCTMTLFSPFQLKHLTLRNRIVMPGMDTIFGDEEGNIVEDTYRYYERRAKGGAGLIIVEGACFDKRGAGTQNMLALDSRRRIPQFSRLVETIKKHGARALLQIYHAGSQATSFMVGLKAVGPSDVPFQMSGKTPGR
jgi:2,4-dienoyl-CoA reductase-like NADH-dependent reductase (Old Yellow Enzyme family)